MAPIIMLLMGTVLMIRIATGTDTQTVREKANGVDLINQHIFPDNIQDTIIIEHTLKNGTTHYLTIHRPTGGYYLTIYKIDKQYYYKLEEVTPIITD